MSDWEEYEEVCDWASPEPSLVKKEKKKKEKEEKWVVKKPVAGRDGDLNLLDLAFAMDCTASMSGYIVQARQNIKRICKDIVENEDADLRLALVEYRDHPPQDTSFITRVNDFTEELNEMQTWLSHSSASGGGDTAEAVADALDEVRQLNWRDKACKICVFIADAPPHGLGSAGDGFPDGCPLLIDPIECAYSLAKKGVTIYMVGCESSVNQFKEFYMALSHLTGGQYVPLKNAESLAKVIIGGAKEQISLQKILEEVEQMVLRVHAAEKGITEEALCTTIHTNLTSGSFKHRAKQLSINNAALPGATDQAQNWARFEKLSDLRKAYQPTSRRTVDELDKQVGDITSEKSYNVDEGEVTLAQAQRLVRQVIAKHKLKVAT